MNRQNAEGFQGCEAIPYDTIMVDADHYTFM